MNPRKPGMLSPWLAMPTLLTISPFQCSVTETSILALKKRALRRNLKIARRVSTGHQSILQSRLYAAGRKLRELFSRDFWVDMWEDTGKETLVDRKLLSYAYLEAGVIETLAA
jgi:hypothetical protein